MIGFEGLTEYTQRVLSLVDSLDASKLEVSAGVVVGALLTKDLPVTDRLALITCLSLTALNKAEAETNASRLIQQYVQITKEEIEAAKKLIERLKLGDGN